MKVEHWWARVFPAKTQGADTPFALVHWLRGLSEHSSRSKWKLCILGREVDCTTAAPDPCQLPLQGGFRRVRGRLSPQLPRKILVLCCPQSVSSCCEWLPARMHVLRNGSVTHREGNRTPGKVVLPTYALSRSLALFLTGDASRRRERTQDCIPSRRGSKAVGLHHC